MIREINSVGERHGKLISYGTGPVSYTHLDVYKRQVQGLFKIFFCDSGEQALCLLFAFFRKLRPSPVNHIGVVNFRDQGEKSHGGGVI